LLGKDRHLKQAWDLSAHVRKDEDGRLVFYTDKIVRAEIDAATGEECEPRPAYAL
jgi:antirestriction protein ArdC